MVSIRMENNLIQQLNIIRSSLIEVKNIEDAGTVDVLTTSHSRSKLFKRSVIAGPVRARLFPFGGILHLEVASWTTGGA